MKNREEHKRLTISTVDCFSHTANKLQQVIISKIRKHIYLVSSICISLLSGCSNPYALRVDSVDYSVFENKDHAKAAIQMSPPTIYARETLINDRRREHEYLEQVLKDSKTKPFESELRRELTNISALSASLGLAFDQGSKEEFLKQRALSESETNLTIERLSAASEQLELQQSFESDRLAAVTEQNQLINQHNVLLQQSQINQAKLQQRLALEKLRLELKRQQYEVERLQSIINDNRERAAFAEQANQGEESIQERQSTALDALPDSGSSSPIVPGSAFESGLSLHNNPAAFNNRDLGAITIDRADSQAILTSLNTKLTHALNLLKTESKKAQGVDVSLSPEQEFSARQAYRRTIRSAIAENNLDDLHDKGGNSLFRLQFTATVLPGEDTDRWGLASYSLSPPKANSRRLGHLYNEWLTHITLRLNETANIRDNNKKPMGLSNIRYELMQSTGLYDVIYLHHSKKNKLKPIYNCFVADSLEVAKNFDCISIPLAVPPKSGVEFSTARLYWDHILLNVLFAKLSDAINRSDYEALTSYQIASNTPKLSLSDFYQATSLEEAILKLRNETQTIADNTNISFNSSITQLTQNAKNYRERNKFLDEYGVSANRAHIIQKNFDQLYKFQSSVNKVSPYTKSTSPRNSSRSAKEPTEIELIEVLKKLSLRELGEVIPVRQVLRRVRVYRQLGPSVAKSVEGVVRRIILEKTQREQIIQILEKLSKNIELSQRALTLLDEMNLGNEKKSTDSLLSFLTNKTVSLPPIEWLQLQTGADLGFCPPKVFANAVLAQGSNYDSTKLPDCGIGSNANFSGEARSYSTTPRVRSQRVSTISSAVDAFELGLSLAAKAPSVGLRGDAGVGLARTAAGKVQAREQVPLVVGFAAAHDIDSSQNAKFGWVFGPRTIVDAENKALKLKQQVTTHDVTADISMPGWWPYAKAVLKTSWISNEWKTGELEPKKAKTKHLDIKLTQTRADLDGLTDYIAQMTVGKSLQTTQISSVHPESISLCRNSTRLVLHGSNLWRGTQIFLDGIRANTGTIQVLPDMEGIEAEFDTTSLHYRSNGADQVPLMVWTRDGFAVYSIDISGEYKDGQCTDNPPQKTTTPNVQLVSLVPDKLSSCLAENIDLNFVATLRGLNLNKKPLVMLGGNNVKTEVLNEFGEKEEHIDILKFSFNNRKHHLPYWRNIGSIPLIVLGKKHSINHNIPILSVPTVNCGNKPSTEIKFDTIATKVFSVSGEGTIDVCSNKLMLGLNNAKGGLNKVKKIEWLGQKVDLIPGSSGKNAHALFYELPKLLKRGADTLPLHLIDNSNNTIGTLNIKTSCESSQIHNMTTSQ